VDLADGAIGTAHATTLQEGESFTSVDIQIKFFRPVWKTQLKALARPHQTGRTLTYYICDILDASGKLVALAVTAPRRMQQLPEVPPMAEAGYADFDVTFWAGLLAP
ncbi:tripartite tricarboxylate transporter substrate-binding protein, partial [Glaesserella parasuis]|uniref:PaaI family thioesterase n=1 Tax=Glaesserella parasuis TaxID=738 RepID=UPI003F2EFABB